MSRRLFAIAPALVCAALMVLVATDQSWGQVPAVASKEVRSAEPRIEQALDAPVTFEFTETPLGDVVEYLKQQNKIEVQIDRRALDDLGIGADTPITRDLKGVSLRSALELMLRDLDLTYTVQNEILLITTKEAANEYLSTRIYNVADLVLCQDLILGLIQ